MMTTTASNSAVTLDRLPNEILVMVARDTTLAEEDLSAFLRTCRSIRSAITCVFYPIILERKRVPILHWAVERGLLDLARQILDAGGNPNQYWYSTGPRYVLSPRRDTGSCIPSQEEYWSTICYQQRGAIEQQCSAISPVLSYSQRTRRLLADDDWIEFRLQWAWMAQRAGLWHVKYGWLRSGYLEGSCPISVEHESPGHFKWTPLHLAVYAGDLEMVKMLIDHGSDPNLACSGLCTCNKIHIPGDSHSSVYLSTQNALHLAVCRSDLSTDTFPAILELLLSGLDGGYTAKSCKPPRWYTPIFESLAMACIVGDKRMVDPLLSWIACRGYSVGCSTEDRKLHGDEKSTSTNQSPESHNRFLLEQGIIHCAARSQRWEIIQHLSQTSSPHHSIKLSLESLLQQLDGSDMDVCTGLLQYGLAIHNKGRYLRSLCPAPKSSIYPEGEMLDDQRFAVVMHVLRQCTAAEINDFGSSTNSHNALGQFLTWHFSLECPSSNGVVVIQTMLDIGGDLHLTDPRKNSRWYRKESNLTALGCGLRSTVKNTGKHALESFSHFLQQHAGRTNALVPEGEYLHKFFFFLGYGSPAEMPEPTLSNMARILLLWGAAPEERDEDGESALFAFLNYLRMFVPCWIASEHRPNWSDEIICFLACLQKCGARLDSATAAGRTPEDELSVLRSPDLPFEIFYSGNPEEQAARRERQGLPMTWSPRDTADHEEADKEMRRRMLSGLMRDAVRVVEENGTRQMKFRRPQTLCKDLPGDSFIQQLLEDDKLWWSSDAETI